jgi:CelD/BcsL family acetyltransferase involved in cellulose biosynthesis
MDGAGHDVVTFAALRRSPRWRQWQQLSAGRSPILAPEFFALNRPLAEPGEVLVATTSGPAGIEGVLPMIRRGRMLVALRSDHVPVFDGAGSAAAVPGLWRAIDATPGWDRMVLENLPCASPVATELPRLVTASGGRCRTLAGPRHMYFELPGFEARLSSKMRSNLHRWERKLGSAELERVTSFSHAALEEAFTIEGLGWKSAAGSSMASDPKVVRLYLAAARLFARRGQLSLCFLRVRERRVAVLFCVEDEHATYALKIGYDPALAAMGPGHVVVWKAAQDAERRGLGELELLGRDDEWKRRWTSSAHEHVTLVVYRGSPGGLLQYGLREVVKPRLVPALRRVRERALPLGPEGEHRLGDPGLGRRMVARLRAGLGIPAR